MIFFEVAIPIMNLSHKLEYIIDFYNNTYLKFICFYKKDV